MLVLFYALLISCAANKKIDSSPLPQVNLINAEAFVQKAYPGVSGEVWYFVNYRIEFDLETNVPVRFTQIKADDLNVNVQSVQIDNKILKSDELLDQDTSRVRVFATFPVLQAEYASTDKFAPGLPKKLILYLEAEGNAIEREISRIHAEPNEYRPGVGRPYE